MISRPGDARPGDARLLAVEDLLATDAQGLERDRLLERLRALAAASQANLDKGVAPADARRLATLIAALEAGQTVVRRVWARFHQHRHLAG